MADGSVLTPAELEWLETYSTRSDKPKSKIRSSKRSSSAARSRVKAKPPAAKPCAVKPAAVKSSAVKLSARSVKPRAQRPERPAARPDCEEEPARPRVPPLRLDNRSASVGRNGRTAAVECKDTKTSRTVFFTSSHMRCSEWKQLQLRGKPEIEMFDSLTSVADVEQATAAAQRRLQRNREKERAGQDEILRKGAGAPIIRTLDSDDAVKRPSSATVKRPSSATVKRPSSATVKRPSSATVKRTSSATVKRPSSTATKCPSTLILSSEPAAQQASNRERGKHVRLPSSLHEEARQLEMVKQQQRAAFDHAQGIQRARQTQQRISKAAREKEIEMEVGTRAVAQTYKASRMPDEMKRVERIMHMLKKSKISKTKPATTLTQSESVRLSTLMK